jgi:outer membrane receptor protein involved in Fe transport
MSSTGRSILNFPATRSILKGLMTLLLFAQSICSNGQSGTLKGKVFESKSKEGIPGAIVSLVGTYKIANSDIDGNYSIKDIKPGDYSVKIKSLGHTDKIYNGIRIKAGENTLDIDLGESESELNTVVIVGDRDLINIESGKSDTKVNKEEIKEMNTRDLKEVVSMVNGVSENPDGLQIRGGRVYETQFVVEGLNAQDPLAGTGFGVNIAANAIDNVNVTTGGVDAEYGNGTSGLIATSIREGGDKFFIDGSWQRDNIGKIYSPTAWNTDLLNISLGTPIPFTQKKLTLFTSASGLASDDYYGVRASQLHSSLFSNSEFWAPRQDQSWSNTLKLAWTVAEGHKITLSNVHSLEISQSTRALQVVGEDKILTPGFQYQFSLEPDNATTYTNQNNLTVLNYTGNLNNNWHTSISAGRLFSQSRADANGRPFRDPSADKIYDPAAIVKDPVILFNPHDSFVYVNPSAGLYNNGGISTVWHDHYVEEYSLKLKFNYIPKNTAHYFTFGLDHKEDEYQWVDISSPWIGAPIRINDTLTTPSSSVGASSDIWHVRPAEGGIYAQDAISYKGILATIAMRYNYWAEGTYIDDAISNPNTPILDATRKSYVQHSTNILGRRWKSRLLPKLRVSFPVTENHVLFFNYGHNMQLPHPRFVYAGLNPYYQDQSYLSNLGNPDLNPEVTVSYELGLKSQINKDFAYSIVAFYNDKFDYIVSKTAIVKDQTGHFVEKTFYINQDYARIRGIELSISRRIGSSLRATFNGSYQIATGKSNSALESALQIKEDGFVSTSKENYLAWDRPLDLKFSLIYIPDSHFVHHYAKFLKDVHFFISATYKSGLRYTPYVSSGTDPAGREIYEPIQSQPYADLGSSWFWTDLKISREFKTGKSGAIALSIEVRNLFNNKNAQIIDPVTGRAYENGDPLPYSQRDPKYPNAQDTGTPPNDPSRYLTPRQILYGISIRF